MGLEWNQVHDLPRLFIGLLYKPWMIDGDDCAASNGMNEWQEKTEVLGENLPSNVVSTTDST
jgi:hypothetical protein